MEANMAKLLKDVLENRRTFYIPVYQRNYAWREEQCKQLFDDIMKLYNDEYNEHFVGAIVWKPDDSNSNLLGVIDGQQRLTTMFLLIKALKDYNEDRKLDRSLEDILFDYREEENRLMPIKSDNEVYVKIMNNELSEIRNKSNRVYQNYIYFKNQLEKNKIDANLFYNALDRLQVIKMELGYKDNPQIIFESINSTGMSLSIADLIRNFLLMNEEYHVQKELFDKYWYKFEQRLGTDNLVLFFEHYLNVKIKEKNINSNNMYASFKEYFVANEFNARTLLESLVEYIEAYEFLINKDAIYNLSNSKMTSKLYEYKSDLSELGNKVPYMYLMPTLIDHKNGKITDEELVFAFEMVLSYIMRRSVCGLNTNVLQGTFRRLYSQLGEYHINHGFNNSLMHLLITTKRNSAARFPNDEEFFTALHTRNLYGKYRNINYLLFKLENYNNKTVLAEDNISIEHIMPQTLNSDWKKLLGDDWKNLHEENANDLGNLTLTSYNSSLSNFAFDKKKAILLEESHIKLNQYLQNVNEWNIAEINNRGKELAKIGLEIWRYPQIDGEVSTEIEDEKYNVITLSELIDDYMSIKIKQLKINDNIFEVNSYRGIMTEVIKMIIDLDQDTFIDNYVNNEEYTRTNKGETYFVFSDIKEKVYSPMQIENYNLYWDTNRAGSNICILVRDLLNNIGIDSDDVEIKYYK